MVTEYERLKEQKEDMLARQRTKQEQRIADLERQLAEAKGENAQLREQVSHLNSSLTCQIDSTRYIARSLELAEQEVAATRAALGKATAAIKTLNRQMGIEEVWGIGHCHHCLVCHGTGSDEANISHGDDCPLADVVAKMASAQPEDARRVVEAARALLFWYCHIPSDEPLPPLQQGPPKVIALRDALAALDGGEAGEE